MGIVDHEGLTRDRAGIERPHSAVAVLLWLTCGVWLLQVLSRRPDGPGALTEILAASGRDLFASFPQLWKVVTANFAHDWRSAWHLATNMLFLFFFGRELEQVLGRREFWILYLSAGVLAVLAEVVSLHAAGNDRSIVLGASGAVMAVVVVSTFLNPRRIFLLFFVLPVPVWALCGLFVLQDLAGVLSPERGQVANLAHLAGALFGFLHYHYDLRWMRLSRWLRRRSRRRRKLRRESSVPPGASPLEAEPPHAAPADPVSERIDLLLAKIHAEGMGSLTNEERDFLAENAKRYRSR
jgi:membrane associated rhomboid family serine protease